MKTKNKILVLLEIAVVLCSVFLVALPPIAGNQNQQTTQKVSASEVSTASEDDYILEIFGNANEDDTIDMRDYTYTARIICWLEEETDLADANYDGRISVADMTQIGLIILGRESELTIIDSAGETVTVNKPVERIVVLTTSNGEALQILKATDRVAGIADHGELTSPICFPELSQLPSIGEFSFVGMDYEAILSLNPDVVLTYAWYGCSADINERLPDSIAVIGFDFMREDTMSEEFKKLGYILDKEDEAKEFGDFHDGYLDKIKERTKGLFEDEKPRVYFSFGTYDFYLTVSGADTCWHPLFYMAGGINIAADLEGGMGGMYPEVDPEWLIEQNPDLIIATAFYYAKGGYTSDDPSEMIEEFDYIMALPVLAEVKAVKSGKVYIVHSNTIYGPGGFMVGATYLAKWFHPELFKDLDPQAMHQDYLHRFRGIDFDVYEHGVFVYPPLE